jgi:hypothetical protein
MGVSCKAIQKKSIYLGFLNLSLLSIFLFGCNKFERKFKQLHTGKYTVEGVLFHSLTGKYDTLNHKSYGPYFGTNSCAFRIIQSKNIDPISIDLKEIDNGNIIHIQYFGATIYSYNSNYSISTDFIELNFNSSDTISGKITLKRTE